MRPRHFPSSRNLWPRGIGIALIALMCLAVVLSPVAAAASPASAPPNAAAALHGIVVADWFSAAMGDRTRIIQVGCVGAAIAIFVLTRSIK